ncbi:hypothetical protein ACHWQZ_G004922 [Mnemiopsis leidyi]
MKCVLLSVLLLACSPALSLCRGLEGRQVVKEVFPDPLQSNIDFGVGYNSISLSRTGTVAVTFPHVSPRTGNSAFMSHTFNIRHFPRREALQEEYGKDSDLAQCEGYVGNYHSQFLDILQADKVGRLDSVLAIDVDIVSDTESVGGQVQLEEEAAELLHSGNFQKFIEKYGTHYLRKKTYGGKLIMLMKVRSETETDKVKVDEKLKGVAGYIGREGELRERVEEISRVGEWELDLYTLGGDSYTGSLTDLNQVLDFVLSFSPSVSSRDQVRSLEFNAVWNLVGVPQNFSQFVFPLQKQTDEIVDIYTQLRGVETQISDILQLRRKPLNWISATGHGKIEGIGVCLAKCQKSLTHKFALSSLSSMQDVIEEFKNSGTELTSEIDQVLKKERRYESLQEMYLINTAQLAYVSYQNWEGYSSASPKSRVPLYLENTVPGPNIRYRHSTVYIRSSFYPHQVLCLGRNYYGVFWKSEGYMYPPYCTWTLKHDTDYRKSQLEYGDHFLLNNVNWPSFALGLDTSGSWVLAVLESNVLDGESNVVWQMKRLY